VVAAPHGIQFDEKWKHMRLSLSIVGTLAAVVPASAADVACDLKVGDGVGAYEVVKAGGIDDGVKVGSKLCYL
jgi:hypothetical protein